MDHPMQWIQQKQTGSNRNVNRDIRSPTPRTECRRPYTKWCCGDMNSRETPYALESLALGFFLTSPEGLRAITENILCRMVEAKMSHGTFQSGVGD